ncbi:MAG: ankyrin repeat domain-containing protein [Sedimentisphaerales bacterium]|nr:ankyrin repeat domain-containing protein [Sedimentisphaerales bacterium]
MTNKINRQENKPGIFIFAVCFIMLLASTVNFASSPSIQIRPSDLRNDLIQNRWEVIDSLIRDRPEDQNLSRYEVMILNCAGLSGKIEVVKYYLDRGSDIDKDLSNGFTLLHLAIRTGHTELAEYLIDKGANLTLQTNEKMTPIMLAVTHNRKEIEEMLIKKGIKRDVFTETIRGDIQAVMNYLAEDPNLINQYRGNFSLLHWAAYKGHYDLAKILIETGADVEGHKEYAPPLFWAVRYNRPDIAKLLIDNGADINAQNTNGQTVLFNSARVEITRFLLENGANPGIIDKKGNAPLHPTGSKNMHIEAIRTIIDFNEFPNFPQPESVIQEAVNEQLGVVKLLIEYGANPNLKNNAGKTALDFAIEGGFEQIIRFFSNYPDKALN